MGVGSPSSLNWRSRMRRASRIRLTALEPMSAENCCSRKTVSPSLRLKLEPVPAGDAVAGPVVEVLVADDHLDVGKVGVGRGLGVGEDVAGIEDVEPLVLHRSHVEVVDGDDHVEVEVILEPVCLLVPAHRLSERVHRVPATPDVVRLRVDAKRHLASGCGGEGVLETGEIAGDEGEEVGGLGERIFPTREVAPVVERTGRDKVAVREQDRIVGAGGADGGRVPRKHVRAVREEGDAPEVLRFALGAEDPVRLVEALEGGSCASERSGCAGSGGTGPKRRFPGRCAGCPGSRARRGAMRG